MEERRKKQDPMLNPALRPERDPEYGENLSGTDPMETVSVKNPDEGRSWPMIWAVVTIVCVIIAVALLVF